MLLAKGANSSRQGGVSSFCATNPTNQLSTESNRGGHGKHGAKCSCLPFPRFPQFPVVQVGGLCKARPSKRSFTWSTWQHRRRTLGDALREPNRFTLSFRRDSSAGEDRNDTAPRSWDRVETAPVRCVSC